MAADHGEGWAGSASRPARLTLEPDATSVSQARHWLSGQLSGWSPDGLDTAILLVSELVTNAVLHAGTTLHVQVEQHGPRARIEVIDYAPTVPVLRRYGPGASTGRGLVLVSELAESWGVLSGSGTKSVWLELADPAEVQEAAATGRGDTAGPAGGQALPDLSSWPDLEDWPHPPPAAPADLVDVHILGLPVADYLAAQEHNDALLREFALIAERDPAESVPRRLVELAHEVEQSFGRAVESSRRQVDAALALRRQTVDLVIGVPRTALTMLVHLTDLLDEADAYCRHGELLTLASSPRVTHFRRWYSAQVRSQLSGHPPTPWVEPPE